MGKQSSYWAFGLSLLSSCSLSVDSSFLGAPTYHGQVKQILAQHCTGCHQAGGIAPFNLDSYADAKAHAGSIADSTSAHRMPPFGVNNSGSCHTFKDSNWLTENEIQTLRDWKTAQAPSGQVTAEIPNPSTDLSLDQPDLEISPVIPYTPTFSDLDGDGVADDNFYCYVLPYNESITRNISSVQFIPGIGAEPQDHHALVAQIIDPVSEVLAKYFDGKTPEPGFPCAGTGSIFSGSSLIDAWAPGMMPREFPEGVGIELQPAKSILVQMHYSLALTDEAMPDPFKIQFKFTDQPIVKIKSLAPDSQDDFVLPQGKTKISAEFIMPDSGHLLAGFPHMHLLGRSFQAEHIDAASGTESCLMDNSRYSFNWQQLYFYEEPQFLAAGDTLRLHCDYDNQTGHDVLSGDNSTDEMCVFFFYYY